MENNVDFATIGASAPDTYTNTNLQGSSDLDYQPISPRPAPPAPSAAASNSTQDQAARLRALLSSHLSEGGAGGSQATGADRLEALIDMLYAMTAPTAVVPVAEVAPAATPVVSEEKPSLAPTAESYAVTLSEPVRETPISESISEPTNGAAAPSPAPAPVETPLAQATETAAAPFEMPTVQSMEPASVLAAQDVHNHAAPPAPTPFTAGTESAPSVVSTPSVVSEAQTAPHFAAPESIEARQTEVHQIEARQTTEAPPLEVRETEAIPSEPIQTEVPPEQTPQLDALLTEEKLSEEKLSEEKLTEEKTADEAAVAGETFPVTEPQAAYEPTAFEESPTVSAVGEAMAGEATVQPRVPVTTDEVLTMDERVALLNPLKEMKEERATTTGAITFSFATDKSTATLNIPLQPNLSQITFEQRLDEIILKIHLSL